MATMSTSTYASLSAMVYEAYDKQPPPTQDAIRELLEIRYTSCSEFVRLYASAQIFHLLAQVWLSDFPVKPYEETDDGEEDNQ